MEVYQDFVNCANISDNEKTQTLYTRHMTHGSPSYSMHSGSRTCALVFHQRSLPVLTDTF